MQFIVAALSAGLLLAGSVEAAYTPTELRVRAPAGPIIGHYAKNGNLTTVREFLGIPYAKAPEGDLRWAPPVRAPRWKEPFKADNFSASCYNVALSAPGLGDQEDSPILLPPPTREAEDCLSINIWAPSRRRQLKTMNPGGDAVALWIYGGGFALGTSETPTYRGANIVRDQEGVIVVTFNRLNVFGFPGAPGLEKKNVGLLDVRAAVEWTRDNIAAFGGNPRKIMLFGESAGGAATDAYLYFAKDDPIIHGAVLQSGTIAITNDNLLGGGQTPATRWANFSAALNCPAEPAEESLACLRKVPAATIRSTITAKGLSFSPTADNNTIFSDTPSRLARGEFAKVPVLIGSNDEEIPGNSTQAKLTTKLAFTCPAVRSTIGHASRVPTWQYRFFGNFPAATGDLSPGPFHGSEITQVFGTFVERTATPEQIASSKYIQKAWFAFAKDPKKGLLKLGWPTFKSNETTLVRLAYQNQPNASFVLPSVYSAGCP